MKDLVARETYNIHLPVFDGPFDLLLFFIERDELNIQNIPIARITGDFLEYIRSMESINIDLASEFVLTAATLMKIKARMLLPLKKNEEGNPEADPRAELVNKILIFKSFKEIAGELSQLEELKSRMHVRGSIGEDLKRIREATVSYTELESANLYQLIKTFNRLLDHMGRVKLKPVHHFVDYPYTIQDCKEVVWQRIKQKVNCSFEDIFAGCENRIHAIVTFLAVLEMINHQQVAIYSGVGINTFWLAEKPKAVSEEGIAPET